MWKKRLGYAAFILAFSILVFLFNKPFLLGVAVIFLLAGILSGICLKMDSMHLVVDMDISRGSREGRETMLTFTVHRDRPLLSATALYVEMDLKNEMFGDTGYRRFLFHISRDAECGQVALPASKCGEVSICCRQVFVQDVLGLFRIPITKPANRHIVIYPRQINMQVTLSQAASGSPKDDGIMQNRKGNDPSEMFDLREYTPGDDVRSIHWKLSSKMDNLVLRQASEPAHYNIVLLPDYGLAEMEKESDTEKVNFMLATEAAVCEQLIKEEIEFCMIIPTDAGLKLYEIRTQKDYRKMLSQRLSFKIQEKPGEGLQFFLMEHMQEYFTRMLIFTIKNYEQNISMLEGNVATTIVGVSEKENLTHTNISGDCDAIELPMRQKSTEAYRIRC